MSEFQGERWLPRNFVAPFSVRVAGSSGPRCCCSGHNTAPDKSLDLHKILAMGRIFVITVLLQNMIPLSQNIIIYHEHGPQPDIGMTRRVHKTHNTIQKQLYHSLFILMKLKTFDIWQ